MKKSKIIIVGKLPPPFIGPAVATNIILNSELKNEFDLLHLDTTVNKTVDQFGKGKFSKIGKNLLIYNNLIQLLRKQQVDLILIPISQTTLGFLKDAIFILIAALFPVKILLQLRGSNFKNWMNSASPISRFFVRFCFNRTDGMVVLGNNLRQLFTDYYSPDKIFVVPNGCDIKFPEPDQQSSKIQLLYFANFLPSKGIKEILEALVLAKKNGVNTFELNAIGAWDNLEYKEICHRIVREGKIPVTFHEPLNGEEKWQAFANANIFLFTPNSPEGHPWVIVEALAAGLPIISSNQGAISESVIHEYNGYIVKHSEPSEIAAKLKELVTNSELRKEMGKKSVQHYLDNFTESHMVEKYSRLFKKIIK